MAAAKPKAKARAKRMVRVAMNRGGAFGRPLSAPDGLPWKTRHHRIMWYRRGTSIAIRQTTGQKAQIGSCKCILTTKPEAYEIALEVIRLLETNEIHKEDVGIALATWCT